MLFELKGAEATPNKLVTIIAEVALVAPNNSDAPVAGPAKVTVTPDWGRPLLSFKVTWSGVGAGVLIFRL